jgi:glutaredoxin-like protein NrdH
MTMRVLKSENIAFTKVDITKDSDAYSFVTKELGYLQAPVVVTEDSHWSGFRPDLIKSIERS